MKQKQILFIVGLLLICFAGLALTSVKQHRKWTAPGVKVSVGPLISSDGKTVTTNIVELPPSLPGYESQPYAMDVAEIGGLPADTTFGRRHYRGSDGFEAILSTILMGSDRTSLHPPRYCIEGGGFSIQKIESATITIKKPARYEMPVSKVLISKQVEQNGQKFMAHGVYLYWYVSESSIHPAYNSSFGAMLKSLLRGKPMERWAFVTCFSLCRAGDEDQTFEQMKKFVAAAVPEFQLGPIADTMKGASATIN